VLDALLALCKRKAVPLEQLLQGIFFFPTPDFSYVLSSGELVHVRPEYLLSGFDQHHWFHGLLPMAEKENFVKVLLGFQTNHGGQEEYYSPKEGSWVLQPFNNKHVLYLPVEETNFKQYLCRYKDGQWVPLENVPLPIYGLKKAVGPSYPFSMVFSGSKGEPPAFFGLYRNQEQGKLEFYRMNESGDALEELLEAIDRSAARSKPTIPPPDEKNVKEEKASLKLDPLVLEEKLNWNKPQNIVEYLDRFVVGQEEAKKKMAIVFSLYMKRAQAETEGVALPKGHLILIGPPGVGKTYMTDLLVEKAELPVAKTSVTGKSAAGYVDESLSTVFSSFWAKTKGEEAPFGVIFIDEIDKVVHSEWREDFFGPKQQEELIGWLGGTYVQIGTTERRTPIRMSTNNLLFITAGAFEGDGKRLAKIIAQRQGDLQGSISGFGREGVRPQKYGEQLHAVTPNDLIAYGLRPELVRRLPFIGVLDPLSVDDKIKILKGTEKSVIGRYQNLFALEGYSLALDEAVYELLAKRSPPEVGASGLETACEQLFQEILFSTEEYGDGAQVIRITPELAEKLLEKK